MKHTALFAVSVPFLLVLSLAGCNRGGNAGGPAEDVEPPIPAFAVNTALAEQGPIQDFIGLSGDVIASSMVDAFSEVAGRVERVHVSIGQQVVRGQTLVSIDPSRPGMEFRLGLVTAPVSGTVVAIPAQVGMTISQAVPLVRVAGGNALEVRLFVAERFISRMSMGLPAEISLAAWPGDIFTGRISELSPTIDPVSRTMEIRVRTENPGERLKAGMFANVRLITERRENVVRIPASALVSRFGQQYVYVVDVDPRDGEQFVARRRDVVPGISVDGLLEIREGLEPGEEIVARGQSLLEDGVRINIVERLASPGN